jgi:hypothetical protein
MACHVDVGFAKLGCTPGLLSMYDTVSKNEGSLRKVAV